MSSYHNLLDRNTQAVSAVSFRAHIGLIQAQVIGCGQQLKAKLYRNVHVGHVFAVSVAIPVMKVLDHFVKDHSAVIALVSQLEHRCSKAVPRRFSVSSSVVQDQPDQPVGLSRDIQVW